MIEHPDCFSLKNFIAWLQTQPPEKTYVWGNVDDCVVARFCKSRGYDFKARVESGVNLRNVFGPDDDKLRNLTVYQKIGMTEPWTYSAALTRATDIARS